MVCAHVADRLTCGVFDLSKVVNLNQSPQHRASMQRKERFLGAGSKVICIKRALRALTRKKNDSCSFKRIILQH